MWKYQDCKIKYYFHTELIETKIELGLIEVIIIIIYILV